jgi:hypothetical protein
VHEAKPVHFLAFSPILTHLARGSFRIGIGCSVANFIGGLLCELARRQIAAPSDSSIGIIKRR